MHLRTILYFLAVPMSLFALDSFHFNRFLKEGKVIQARVLYLLISLALSYLIVNFFMDFFTSTVFQY